MFSIILPTYNESRKDVEKTINKLIDIIDFQKYRTEIILIDSSEKEIFYSFNDEKVRIIRTKKQMYPGEARNLGVLKANYNIIVFTDIGFDFKNNWFGNLIKPFLEGENIDIVWGIVDTLLLDKKDRQFAYLVGRKTKVKRAIPNSAFKKSILKKNKFKIDLRAVEDKYFIDEVKDNYNEVFVNAKNYYSGHPRTIINSYKKWNAYSYYSYIAGYRSKAKLSLIQFIIYLIILFLIKSPMNFVAILILQSIRIYSQKDSTVVISIIDFLQILIISFAIDLGRCIGTLSAMLNFRRKYEKDLF